MPSSEIRELCTTRDREMAYRLRFETYCQKLQWIDPTLHPHGMECDPYDPFSIHFGAFEEGNLVGTIRLIKRSHLPFPIDTAYPKATAEDLEVKSLEGVVLGEVSRLIVSPSNGSPQHALCLGLIQALFRKSLHDGVTHWLQAIDTRSYKVINALGFRLRQYAPATHFMGSESLPTTLKLSRCLLDFHQHRPRTYDFFSQDVEPEEIVWIATSLVCT